MKARYLMQRLEELSGDADILINGKEIFEISISKNYRPKTQNGSQTASLLDLEHCDHLAKPKILRISHFPKDGD